MKVTINPALKERTTTMVPKTIMVPVEQETIVKPKTYTVELTEAEAGLIKILVGGTVCKGSSAKDRYTVDILRVAHNIYEALHEAKAIKNYNAYAGVLEQNIINLKYMTENNFVELINQEQ